MKLTDLRRYPVKSLRGHSLTQAVVEPIGLAGDRRWMVVTAARQFLTIREKPVMLEIDVSVQADGITLSHPTLGAVTVEVPKAAGAATKVAIWRDTVSVIPLADDASAAFLSQLFGEDVHLVYQADPSARPVDPMFARAGEHVSLADGYPVLLTTQASLAALNAALPTPVVMNRFRPNIVIDGVVAWEEATWRIVRIGAIRFRVAKPCARCVITTFDLDSGAQLPDGEPLRTLGRLQRSAKGGIIFGQNLVPLDTGAINVGDTVTVLETGPSNLL